MLKEAHTTATHFKANEYRLVDSEQTTGLGTLGSDINDYNSYGMTPVQVALQAGAEDELAKILSHPQCQPLRESRSGYGTYHFLAVFQHGCECHEADAKAGRMLHAVKASVKRSEQTTALTTQEHT